MATWFGVNTTPTWYGSFVSGGGSTGTTLSSTLSYQILAQITDPDLIAAWVSAVIADPDPNADNVHNESILISNDSIVSVPIAQTGLVTFDSIQIFQAPALGRAVAGSTTITYTPNANTVGRDVVGYALIRNGVTVGTGDLFVGIYSQADAPDTTTTGSVGGSVELEFEIIAALDVNCLRAGNIAAAINKLIEVNNKIEAITTTGGVRLR